MTVSLDAQDARSTALTAGEFEQQVLALQPRTAVFDCDGTLWRADAGSGFLHWSLAAGMVSRDTADWVLGRYAQYHRGEVTEAAMCGEMTRMYAGITEAELRSEAAKFIELNIKATIFHAMLELSGKLAAAGTEIWAVSSTNSWVIEAAVSDFGIPPERVLAARVVVAGGVATETLLAVPTGEGKAEALRKVGLERPDVVFGNSIHDGAMLAMAGQAFAVNPSSALLELARLEGWPVFFPER